MKTIFKEKKNHIDWEASQSCASASLGWRISATLTSCSSSSYWAEDRPTGAFALDVSGGGCCCFWVHFVLCLCVTVLTAKADKITIFSYFPEDPLLFRFVFVSFKSRNFHQTFLTGADVLCLSLRVPREKCCCKFVILYQLWLFFCSQAVWDITRLCKM